MNNNNNNNTEQQNIGYINLIIGPMYSGKTSTLVTRYKRHKIAGRKCVMVKFLKDTRYDPDKVVTHDKIKITSIKCELLENINDIVKNYDVICIDEAQFFKDAAKYCDIWANDGKIIEICGLNGDCNRKPFNIISELIPIVENITYLTAICVKTGCEANYTKKINTNDSNIYNDKENSIQIGGKDMYISVDRKTYFEKN